MTVAVCAQLVHFAGAYKEEVGPCGDELWVELLRPAYAQLEGLVDAPAMSGVAAMLRSRPCLWLGDEVGFVSPEHVAFDGGALDGHHASGGGGCCRRPWRHYW